MRFSLARKIEDDAADIGPRRKILRENAADDVLGPEMLLYTVTRSYDASGPQRDRWFSMILIL